MFIPMINIIIIIIIIITIIIIRRRRRRRITVTMNILFDPFLTEI